MQARHPTPIGRRMSPAEAKNAHLVAIGVFYIVIGLWVAFGVTMLVGPDTLNDLWSEFTRLPFVVQGPAGLLFLPWVSALAIRATTVDHWLQLAIVVSVGFMSVYTVHPRRRRDDNTRET
jgi:predicted ferric reductase